MLRRYRSNESHILHVQDIQVQSNFSYDEEPKVILACDVKQLQKKTSPSGKSTLPTPRYGGSNLGARIDNGGTVPATLQFRYEFQGRNYFKRVRIVTPQIIP